MWLKCAAALAVALPFQPIEAFCHLMAVFSFALQPCLAVLLAAEAEAGPSSSCTGSFPLSMTTVHIGGKGRGVRLTLLPPLSDRRDLMSVVDMGRAAEVRQKGEGLAAGRRVRWWEVYWQLGGVLGVGRCTGSWEACCLVLAELRTPRTDTTACSLIMPSH